MQSQAVRRIALALVALLVYVQGSVALAACPMERGAMAQAAAAHECCDTPDGQPGPQLGNGCVVHCTADLQRFELPATLVCAPSDAAVLTVPLAGEESPGSRWLAALPRSAIPPRILFQSFQI